MAGDSTTAFKCPESDGRHQVDHLGEQNPGPNQVDCRRNSEMTACHQPRGMKAVAALLLVTDVPGSKHRPDPCSDLRHCCSGATVNGSSQMWASSGKFHSLTQQMMRKTICQEYNFVPAATYIFRNSLSFYCYL